MPVVDIPKGYDDGVDLTEAQLDSSFEYIETLLNTTKLDSSNIQSGGISADNLASSSVTEAKIDSGAVTTNKIGDNAVTYSKLIAAVQQMLIPVGTVIESAASSTPTGFLAAEGSAVSRTTYAALFSAIGTTFGAGDGSTTFNLPDRRGRTGIGAGTGSGLTARSLGGTVGAETHTLATSEIPAHTHNMNTAVHSIAGTIVANTNGGSGGANNIVSDSTGGGGAHNNMQPSLVMKYYIKY